MLSTLFTEYYWFGLILAAVLVFITISVKRMSTFEPISKLYLLLFIPIFLSWYYVCAIFLWTALSILLVFARWLINDIRTFFD